MLVSCKENSGFQKEGGSPGELIWMNYFHKNGK